MAILLLLSMLTASAAAAKSIDCTGKSGTGNCPRTLSQVKSGPLRGKFILTGTNGADRIRGSKAGIGDLIRGNNGNDVISGERGDDILVGGKGNDRLDGGGGNDVLKGEAGNDTLSADAGRDRLIGGAGNDTYRIVGGGHIVADGRGSDVLRLPKADPAKTTFRRIGPDLVIRFNGGEVRVQAYFGGGRIEAIQLQGGRTALITKTSGSRSKPKASSASRDGLGGFVGADRGFVQVGRGGDRVRVNDVDLTNPEDINRAVREANLELDRRAAQRRGGELLKTVAPRAYWAGPRSAF